MNPFNVDERDLLTGALHMRRSDVSHISPTATTSHYFGTRTISPISATGFATVNSALYTAFSTILTTHGQPPTLEGLNIYTQKPYEAAVLAAKDERRRQNTAASARFRVKKKQKEKAIDQRMAQVQDKHSELEERVNQLEMENKWLKELITKKNKRRSSDCGNEHDEAESTACGRTGNEASGTDDGESSL